MTIEALDMMWYRPENTNIDLGSASVNIGTLRSISHHVQCLNRVRCTINRSHSTPCKKAEFEHLQIFPGHCLDFFLSVSGKICHSPIKKVKRQPTLIISFSQHPPFFGEQSKNPGWNPTRVRRYLGSAPGSLWQNSPHKDAFFCISLTNIDQCWITCTFKVE